MPSHKHKLAGGASVNSSNGTMNVGNVASSGSTQSMSPVLSTTLYTPMSIVNEGGDQPHENRQSGTTAYLFKRSV